MWKCDKGDAQGNPSGFAATKFGLENHLRATGHPGGFYTYGGRNADRTRVRVVQDPDGRFAHILDSGNHWEKVNRSALYPGQYRIVEARAEASRTVTFIIVPEAGTAAYRPGQFAMVHVPSWEDVYLGEIPISVSGIGPDGALALTVRRVGPLSNRVNRLQPGDVMALRGPFGKGWDLEAAKGHDVLLVAGGCGLAPLRPALWELVNNRQDYGQVTLLYGAKTAGDLLYSGEVLRWQSHSVDFARILEPRLVTDLIDGYGYVTAGEPHAFVCGPEPMMLATGRKLRGMGAEHIQVSVERYMQCGTGECGLCKLPNHKTVCKDGPVFEFDDVEQFMMDGSFKRSIRRPSTRLAGLFGK